MATKSGLKPSRCGLSGVPDCVAMALEQDYWELLQAVMRRLMEGDPIEEIMADVIEILLADWNEYMEDMSMNLETTSLIENSISPQHQ